MKMITSRLGVKLFLAFLAVILVGMAALILTARLATPRAYQRHFYLMEQQIGVPGMMGRGPGPQTSMMAGLYQEYLASFNESLLLAAGIASLVAVAASILLSRGITLPLRRLMAASQRISEGQYSERVDVTGVDELADLGTRFNHMAEQLEQVENRRRQLVGDVAHELRTPLTTIKGSMEGLIDGLLPATPETFEQIHREAGRLNRIVDDLQELSRVEAKTYQLDLRPVDLSLLLQNVMKRLDRQYKEKNVQLVADSPRDGLRILVDSDRIEQVLTNLLVNALTYSQPGGTVKISTSKLDHLAQVSIRDEGTGIRHEHLNHIFDRFYRVDKSRSRVQGGSGIGLTIAKHLVESHGGRIWAESEGEGKGSVFHFTLPLAG